MVSNLSENGLYNPCYFLVVASPTTLLSLMACSSTSCEELLREVKRAVEAVNEVKQAVAARNEEHQQQIALLNGEVKKAIATIVDDVKHALAAMKGHACDSERLIVDIKSLRGVAIITEKATDDVGLQLTNLNLRVNEDHQFFRDGWAAIQKVGILGPLWITLGKRCK